MAAASDFDRLLTTDPVRDILRWLNDPAGTREQWGPGVWGAFRSVCKTGFAFDPETEGELTGAEKLGGKEGEWRRVWARFAESPRLYPHLPDLLRKAERGFQQDLFADRSSWLAANEKEEETLRAAQPGLEAMPPHEACTKIHQLEGEHGTRRGWVWADLGMSPLPQALLHLAHLAHLADVAGEALGGATADDMAACPMWRFLATSPRPAGGAARSSRTPPPPPTWSSPGVGRRMCAYVARAESACGGHGACR